MGVYPFSTYVLRKYYQATGWNEDNLFSNLTRSSDALLDFSVPKGLQFSISKAPNALFRTTYTLNALPSLNGSVGYIFSTCELDLKNSGSVRFKDVVERFKVYGIPKKPEGKEEEWLAGRRVDTRDYLLSGLLYIPTGQLDAFYTTRWSRTTQLSAACILTPPASSTPGSRYQSSLSSSDTMLLGLQHDTGRWGTEYTWQAESGGGSMLGLRVLRNFGKMGNGGGDATVVDDPATKEVSSNLKRVDEEDAMEGGLKGRLSAGAELYLSTEKSAGVSAGIRFTTLPDSALAQSTASSSSSSSSSKQPFLQPPTICTATFTPITGHLSAAYAAKVSRDLALCSRFTFNINSYESEWTMGGEWWLRKKRAAVTHVDGPNETPETALSLSESPDPPLFRPEDEIQGVVKARLSTSSDMAFMWEGRIRNALVSFGVISNLVNRSKPITAIGLELAYFSSE
ncbi:mitochondrial distribution and morphology protein 10 [Fomitiporia mediterranea MF3/22]|uniref:mitochondrial distribution and morphology protein 10 n=1 Tax=Fomitiporia mediterranea (strain MF3/22) TaxID=694068 RepID=UPI00044095EE|nr:mitochondrial distribution and morphology protein 10 [Fomitiporia mediterranea MF3/22]EJD01213.1 mitochondrial distribution and morphology protein 10 [Fomitiporia mediterranea MF3/22]